MPLTYLTVRQEPQVTRTTTCTLTPSDSVVFANGTFTVNLYDVSGDIAAGDIGRLQTIRNIGTGAVTVKANGAQLIDASNTLTLGPGESVRMSSDGAQWWTILTDTQTVNNATYAYGKTEGNLNVNAATYVTGTVLTANNADYAYGKTEGNLNVNSAVNANQATYLGGVAVYGNTSALNVGANVYVNATTAFFGNASVNTVVTAGSITINGTTVGGGFDPIVAAIALG